MQSYWLSNEQEVNIPGECGNIQAGYSGGIDSKTCLLVCHPHPLHQGSMFNKVVTTIIKAGRKHQISCLRFNYRGVGKSVGSFDQGKGEMNDAVTCGQWLLEQTDCEALWLVGFSFGAAIAYNAQAHLPSCGVVLVCPSVIKMGFLAANQASLSIIQAGDDEIISPEEVANWAQKNQPNHYQMINQASHFFHGKLLVLQECIETIIEKSSYP